MCFGVARTGRRVEFPPLDRHHSTLLCRPGRAFGCGSHFAEGTSQGGYTIAGRWHAPLCGRSGRTCEDNQRAVGLWRRCKCLHEGEPEFVFFFLLFLPWIFQYKKTNLLFALQDRASAAFIAAQNGHRTVLSLLILAHASMDIKRIDGATPLWIAAQMGHDHICKVLLQNGANVDTVRCDGATPLFKAAHKGHASVVTVLLKYRPNLGLLPNGETALHAAAMFGHMTVCKQLVAAGSDIMVKNQDGLTAMELAHHENYTSIRDYLRERMRALIEHNTLAMAKMRIST